MGVGSPSGSVGSPGRSVGAVAAATPPAPPGPPGFGWASPAAVAPPSPRTFPSPGATALSTGLTAGAVAPPGFTRAAPALVVAPGRLEAGGTASFPTADLLLAKLAAGLAFAIDGVDLAGAFAFAFDLAADLTLISAADLAFPAGLFETFPPERAADFPSAFAAERRPAGIGLRLGGFFTFRISLKVLG